MTVAGLVSFCTHSEESWQGSVLRSPRTSHPPGHPCPALHHRHPQAGLRTLHPGICLHSTAECECRDRAEAVLVQRVICVLGMPLLPSGAFLLPAVK